MANPDETNKLISRIRAVRAELFALDVTPEMINYEKSSFEQLAQFASEIEDQLQRRKRFKGLIPPSRFIQKFSTREWQEYERKRRETGKSVWGNRF